MPVTADECHTDIDYALTLKKHICSISPNQNMKNIILLHDNA
jgi:hypothetical protein